MTRTPKQYEDDDGRTIINMNVPGMPWYHEEESAFGQNRSRARRSVSPYGGDELTTKQTIRYTFYSLLASFVVFGVVGGGMILFILILWLCWR